MEIWRQTLAKRKYAAGQKFGDWTLLSPLGGGGNGEVWIAENLKGEKAAIKILKKLKPIAYARFIDECKVIRENQTIPGVMPMFDYYLPEEISELMAWYVMPIATPISKHLKEKNAEEIVAAIIAIGETLIELHNKNITHRDIKPENLFWLQDSYYIGDFGLVDYPDKKTLTGKREEIGPKWTMAPEMRRNPDKADGKFADVYSIAKTLWILLTKEIKGFEGQYVPDHHIGIGRYQRTIYTNPLDLLIEDCTQNDPLKRPILREFTDRLRKWIIINQDFGEQNRLQWIEIQNILFHTALPKRVIWEDKDSIYEVLRILSSIKDLNHMFMPYGGGLDLNGVKKSFEQDCLELDVGGFFLIIKPKRLIFDAFGDDPEWNYFRLETENLAPINSSNKKHNEEVFTELEPGLYTDYECFEYNDFNGKKLPPTARPIRRLFKGDFVIFQTTSTYNKTGSTYDGRHNKVDADNFRKYIYKAIQNKNKEGANHNLTKRFIQPKYVGPEKYIENSRILLQHELELINKIIEIAEEKDKEDSEIKAKIGLSNHFIMFDDKAEEYLRYKKPRRNELRDFIKKLSQAQLEIIAAVMYGGREYITDRRTPPFQDIISYFKGKHTLAESILGKAPLAKYLRAGIKAYTGKLTHISRAI